MLESNKITETLKKFIPQIILLVLVIFFTIMNSRFLSTKNLVSVVRQVSTSGIACLGISFLLITGELDFSMGALYAFTGVFTASIYAKTGMPIYLVMLISLVCAAIISCFTCWITIKFNVPRLIISIAMQTAINGLNVIISGNKTLYGLPDSIKWIGQGYIGPIPISTIIFITLAFVVAFVLNKTYLGRYIMAVGGNNEVARLSGINTNKIKYIASIIAAVLAGLAGLVAMSRTFCGSPSAGSSISSDIISAAVLGGVSIMGGQGKTSGLVTGVIIIGALNVGLNMMNMSSNAQDIFKGSMLVVAIIIDSLTKSGRVKSRKKKAD
ncbi:MAG: ABC transporter permease [Erysipelotrichaceae bacterium]|nr:ABC transporter permease [Erysipelotrichaceae bacterium]